jgi:DNA-binding response OmpR family regulator
MESDTYYNSAEVYISFIRKKLEGIHAEIKVKSIRNVGYKLLAPGEND